MPPPNTHSRPMVKHLRRSICQRNHSSIQNYLFGKYKTGAKIFESNGGNKIAIPARQCNYLLVSFWNRPSCGVCVTPLARAGISDISFVKITQSAFLKLEICWLLDFEQHSSDGYFHLQISAGYRQGVDAFVRPCLGLSSISRLQKLSFKEIEQMKKSNPSQLGYSPFCFFELSARLIEWR